MRTELPIDPAILIYHSTSGTVHRLTGDADKVVCGRTSRSFVRRDTLPGPVSHRGRLCSGCWADLEPVVPQPEEKRELSREGDKLEFEATITPRSFTVKRSTHPQHNGAWALFDQYHCCCEVFDSYASPSDDAIRRAIARAMTGEQIERSELEVTHHRSGRML